MLCSHFLFIHNDSVFIHRVGVKALYLSMGRTLDVIGLLAPSISFISQHLGLEVERMRYLCNIKRWNMNYKCNL